MTIKAGSSMLRKLIAVFTGVPYADPGPFPYGRGSDGSHPIEIRFKIAAIGLSLLLAMACATDQDRIRVAEERIAGIQQKNLDTYLKVDYYYVAEIDKMQETQPKAVWEGETRKIKQKYRSRFEETIHQVPTPTGQSFGPNIGGLFLYPKMTWKVLEVRSGTNVVTTLGQTLSSYRVFAQLDFADKEHSPYEKYNYEPYSAVKYVPQGRPIKRTILYFNVVTTLSVMTVVDIGEVVEGREYWPSAPK